MYRKISDCTSKIKHRDPRDTGAQIYARGVYRHFRWYFLNYSIKFIIHMRVTYVCMCGLSAYILTYTCNTGTRSSFIYEFSSLFFSFFLLWIPYSFFFFLFFIRLLFFFYFCFISTCFGFVNVGRNPSCEIWRKNPNSRAYARRDAKVLQLREMLRRVSHEINDRSLLTSIDEIFFFQVYFERITSRRFFLIKKFMFTFDSPYVYTCARSG